MRRFPSYDRTTLTSMHQGRTVHHVKLRALNECGKKITGSGSDIDPDVAEALAFRKLAFADSAAIKACQRRGKHDH